MSFTIISTISPDFASALDVFVPTWHANSGASEIAIHTIDQGSWSANIVERNQIIHDEVVGRSARGEKVLSLDIDCLVLRDLSGGFSPDHPFSVSRWPEVQMGAAFFNTSIDFPWKEWMDATMAMVRERCTYRDTTRDNRQHDQFVWKPRLWAVPDKVCKLGDWEWNYNFKEIHQWERDLPLLRDITKVLHLKGHGPPWPMDKIEFAKRLWPEELSCIP
jgi:hypothetical protein